MLLVTRPRDRPTTQPWGHRIVAEAVVASATSARDDIAAAMRQSGALVFTPDADSLPDLVIIHKIIGLVVIDVVDRNPEASVELNRRLANLREIAPSIARTTTTRRIVDLSASTRTDKVLSVTEAVGQAWTSALLGKPLEADQTAELTEVLAPRLALDLPQRTSMSDDRRFERAEARIVLDADQNSAAQHANPGVIQISGPPGSGKTLVLVARATWLAEQHPDWQIQILCFNRVLVPYLRLLVAGFPNISVDTFGKFSHKQGFRVALDDEDRALRDVARVIEQARRHPTLDALLIDEHQDFMPSWTMLATALVRGSRGGTTLAGDPNQALYRDPAIAAGLGSRTIEHIKLHRSYRSTQQILTVTSALIGEPIASAEDSFEGQPVDLVWAENADQQAAAVARDVRLLLEQGERLPQDIGVLVTRKFQMGKLMGHLREEGVPCRTVYPNQADDLDFSEPSVKVLTVHSAKGLEFDVVFLVGLEHLPDPDGTPENDRQGRTGYVGSTRARDQLVLTYSKDNLYLDRVRALPDSLIRRWVWPDDYPEA